MFHPSPPRRRSAPFAAALAIAAAVTGASAVPASAVTSTTCQYADCISGCDGLLNENLPRDLGVLKRRQRTKRLTVPWRGATTRADRTGRNYQVGSADITWNRHGDPHKFHTDNVCAGTLKFGDVNYGFCDAP